jgi:hypothetical protein
MQILLKRNCPIVHKMGPSFSFWTLITVNGVFKVSPWWPQYNGHISNWTIDLSIGVRGGKNDEFSSIFDYLYSIFPTIFREFLLFIFIISPPPPAPYAYGSLCCSYYRGSPDCITQGERIVVHYLFRDVILMWRRKPAPSYHYCCVDYCHASYEK